MGNIPPYFLKRIQEAKELDLSWDKKIGKDQKLIEIPEEVFELEDLTVLKLQNHRLTEIPESLKKLSKLNSLYLRNNQLKYLSDSISDLPELAYLVLGYNQIIELPKSLKNLSKLKYLFLNGNQFNRFPETLTQLSNLTELSLSKNQLKELPEYIKKISTVKKLYLNENQLIELPEAITYLSNLTRLFLSKNKLTSLPQSIDRMSNLQELYLEDNQLTELPESITHLSNLNKLRLNGNPLISPPLTVVSQGKKAIKSYFREYIYEAKLIIVGDGGAGKTTLAKKLKNSKYRLRKNEESTQGIDIMPWYFKNDNHREFRVNIWDFGGQVIYRHTHQFFLTKRSLYILVLDSRQENKTFYRWLNIVETLSDNSPIIIIQNEKQDRKQEIKERQLRGEFNNLKSILATNLDTNRGLEKIEREIKHYISSLPHVGNSLPKSWIKVREVLEKDYRKYISLDEYSKICKKQGCNQWQSQKDLSSYLNDLGVILHFRDDEVLKNIVILKPEWGTDAVYRVLDNEKVRENLGKFTISDIDKIWHKDEYIRKKDELLKLMRKFKLCYEIPSQPGHYIAPQLLSENQPEYNWDEVNNLVLRYKYEFMPEGILT